MTDSNKGRELDDLKNAENEALDNRAKPDLIAKTGDGGGSAVGAGGFNPGVGNPVRGVPPVNTPAAPVNNPATVPRIPNTPQQNSTPQNVRPPAAPVNGGGSSTQSTPTPKAKISLPTTLPPNIQFKPPTTPEETPTYKGKVFEDPVRKLYEKNPLVGDRKPTESPGQTPKIKKLPRIPGHKKQKPGFNNGQFHQNPGEKVTGVPKLPETPSKEVQRVIEEEFGINGNPPAKYINPGGVVRQQPRASQQPANNNNTPENQPAQSRTPGRSKKRQPTRSRQQQSGRSTANSTRAQEAKKKAVEKEVAKLQDRDIGNLPNGLEERLKEVGYTIARGKTTSIRYHGNLPSGSQLHIKNGSYDSGTIEQGPAPTNNRAPSNSSNMAKNFKETYGEDVPKGDNNHHGISVGVYNKDPLCQAADKAGVSKVDGGDGLIAAPSNSNSYDNKDTGRSDEEQQAVDKLNAHGGRLDEIAHTGSHANLDRRATKALKDEADELKRDYRTDDLNKIPKDVLKNSVEKVRQELLQELRDANAIIKGVKAGTLPKSELKKLPDYIQRYDKLQDSKGNPPQPGDSNVRWRITQKPNGDQNNRFREVASRLKDKANQDLTTTYTIGKTPINLLTEPLKTSEELAYFNARYLSKKMEGRDYLDTGTQVITRTKSGTIEAYDYNAPYISDKELR
jgi:hypothetical protein